MFAHRCEFQQYYVQGEQLLYQALQAIAIRNRAKAWDCFTLLWGLRITWKKTSTIVLCQMKNGRKGFLSVNGKDFNQPMPGVRSLTELEDRRGSHLHLQYMGTRPRDCRSGGGHAGTG